jgi:hypothetical protein
MIGSIIIIESYHKGRNSGAVKSFMKKQAASMKPQSAQSEGSAFSSIVEIRTYLNR